MRKVAWDRGPVRMGSFVRHDGSQVPLWHDSEVAAIAYAIQNIMSQRNDGGATALVSAPTPIGVSEPPFPPPSVTSGKKCHECGAHAVIRKDGCDYCTQCGAMGSCG